LHQVGGVALGQLGDAVSGGFQEVSVLTGDSLIRREVDVG
jgi:hypothetical protein